MRFQGHYMGSPPMAGDSLFSEMVYAPPSRPLLLLMDGLNTFSLIELGLAHMKVQNGVGIF